MKKLRLELDQLTVDSFDTAHPAAPKGTVIGEEQCTCPSACATNCTCPGCPTCDHTQCNQVTCASCAQTCYPCGTDYGYTCDYYTQSHDPYNCSCCPF